MRSVPRTSRAGQLGCLPRSQLVAGPYRLPEVCTCQSRRVTNIHGRPHRPKWSSPCRYKRWEVWRILQNECHIRQPLWHLRRHHLLPEPCFLVSETSQLSPNTVVIMASNVPLCGSESSVSVICSCWTPYAESCSSCGAVLSGGRELGHVSRSFVPFLGTSAVGFHGDSGTAWM